MDYANGVWSNDGFGDRGWLAIALVIFAVWKPNMSILGSIVFGGLYIVYLYVPSALRTQELFKMIPYVVTILVLILVSVRKKKRTKVLLLSDCLISEKNDKFLIDKRRLLWLILMEISKRCLSPKRSLKQSTLASAHKSQRTLRAKPPRCRYS